VSLEIDLSGRVALVTGGSRGLGRADALTLARAGADVVVADILVESEADSDDTDRYGVLATVARTQGLVHTESTAGEIRAMGRRSLALKCDVTDRGQVDATVARVVEELGSVDILVNNAGSLVMRRGIREVTGEFIDDVLALNLKSAVLACQAVVPSMIERRRGSIVNVVSIAGHTGGGPGAGAYAASKAALAAYTKSLAKELAPHGVRVNAVSPGVIDTPFHETFSSPEMMRSFASTIPLGRVGTPPECATVIAFLASSAASYIVGETIEVNGGQLMR
jgi:3-oxoacyl-[acyl-carrier protein] reductase